MSWSIATSAIAFSTHGVHGQQGSGKRPSQQHSHRVGIEEVDDLPSAVLNQMEREKAIAAYHDHHEMLGSVWNVHALLVDCGVAVSPTLLEYLLVKELNLDIGDPRFFLQERDFLKLLAVLRTDNEVTDNLYFDRDEQLLQLACEGIADDSGNAPVAAVVDIFKSFGLSTDGLPPQMTDGPATMSVDKIAKVLRCAEPSSIPLTRTGKSFRDSIVFGTSERAVVEEKVKSGISSLKDSYLAAFGGKERSCTTTPKVGQPFLHKGTMHTLRTRKSIRSPGPSPGDGPALSPFNMALRTPTTHDFSLVGTPAHSNIRPPQALTRDHNQHRRDLATPKGAASTLSNSARMQSQSSLRYDWGEDESSFTLPTLKWDDDEGSIDLPTLVSSPSRSPLPEEKRRGNLVISRGEIEVSELLESKRRRRAQRSKPWAHPPEIDPSAVGKRMFKSKTGRMSEEDFLRETAKIDTEKLDMVHATKLARRLAPKPRDLSPTVELRSMLLAPKHEELPCMSRQLTQWTRTNEVPQLRAATGKR